MEALTAVQVGLLTVYDICKAVDRGMVIEGVQLLEKRGGPNNLEALGVGDLSGSLKLTLAIRADGTVASVGPCGGLNELLLHGFSSVGGASSLYNALGEQLARGLTTCLHQRFGGR